MDRDKIRAAAEPRRCPMAFITHDQLERMMETEPDLILIDVLARERFDAGHIPGSHSLPLDEPGFVAKAEGMIDDKQRHLVVYCASTSCTASTRAAEALRGAGFTNVDDFKGGMDAWTGAGLPVRSGVSAG